MAESQGPLINTVAIVFATISFITISLRLFARISISRSLGTDDWLICVAVLLSWAFIGCTIAAVERGMGQHIEEVSARGTPNMVSYLQIVWLSSIFYNACLGFIKVSVLALYKRLGDPMLSRVSLIMMGVIVCQAGGNVLACIFQCDPVRGAYDITIPAKEMKCININAFYLANAAVNIFTDILTYTLPIPLVIKLQMPRRQKIGVAVILCLGLFACISSILRITYVPPMLTSKDGTWVISGAMYWSVIEINIGILASSVPSFKTVITRYAPSLLGSSNHKSSTKRSGFHMMPVGSQSHADAEASKTKKSGLETRITRGMSDSGSEEDLVNVSGQIMVKTEIRHNAE